MFASAPSIVAERWPGRSGEAGSAASRGAKLCAAGIARRAFPWRQVERAAPQARRREGLEPNGRDDKDGTGRSPQSPAVQGTDTPRSVAASFCHMRNKYIWRTKHHFHAKISTIMHNIAN